MFRVYSYVYQDKYVMKFHVIHKTELAISLRQNIGLWKQIALAITFGLATAILKDFFYLRSSDLI